MNHGSADEAGERVVVLNPVSGDGDHADRVRALAADRGFRVAETDGAGDAVEIARDSAKSGAGLVAAAGGDGTVNEVVGGLVDADVDDRPILAVVPAGTGNNFAANIGVEGIDHAFEVIDDGDTRTVDLGTANGRVFVNSCIGGLTAEASAETSSEAKARWGVLAYVLSTLRTAVEFEGLRLHIETSDTGERVWSGDAAFVLVGNGRRFPTRGRAQANMEDGRLDVTIIEERPSFDIVGDAALHRLLDAEFPGLTRLQTPGLEITAAQDEPVVFSLDGEMITTHQLRIEVDPGALRLRVGGAYELSPARPRSRRA